MKQLEAREMKS